MKELADDSHAKKQRRGSEVEAQASRLPLEWTDFPFAELLFVLLGAHLLILHFVLEHVIYDPSNLVRCGHVRLGWAETRRAFRRR